MRMPRKKQRSQRLRAEATKGPRRYHKEVAQKSRGGHEEDIDVAQSRCLVVGSRIVGIEGGECLPRPQLFFKCTMCLMGHTEDVALHKASQVHFSTFNPINPSPEHVLHRKGFQYCASLQKARFQRSALFSGQCWDECQWGAGRRHPILTRS